MQFNLFSFPNTLIVVYHITHDCRISNVNVNAMSGCCDIWRKDLRRVLTISA